MDLPLHAPSLPFPKLTNWILCILVILGAFLLFLVQPLVSKFLLPWFGGAPAVWTASMLFFQTTLCFGYFYGHRLRRRLSLRLQILIHASLSGAALLFLPIAPNPGWRSISTTFPVFIILGILLVSIGLPFLLLSATSPLVQTWYAIANPGRDPYRLYSLSNVGSLLGLLCYPFLMEPAFTLTQQSWLWSFLFVLYAGSIITLSFLWRGVSGFSTARGKTTSHDAPNAWESERPSAVRRVLWLMLPACGSVILLATTNKVCQDIAAVPFLWVLPLSLYLLTFIICFQHGRWYLRGFWTLAAAAAVLFLSAYEHFPRFDFFLGVGEELALYFISLFLVCMVCHGELARLKPRHGWLTEFYLALALGGALGGVLVAVVAPLVFSSFLEWKIGLAGSYLVAMVALASQAATHGWGRLSLWACGFAAAAGLFVMIAWSSETLHPVERVRNFYGILAVLENEDSDSGVDERMLTHGRVLHGRQFLDPTRRALPTSYYGPASGIAMALQVLGDREGLRAGLVGLGVGTLATYARPGDTYRFYEVNPAVVKLARQYFTYLDDCRGECEVIFGDARLSLEGEPPQHFDLLVLDAFSGDSIPAHLLTREAFAVYLHHLAPRGILAVHTTNKHLRLAPVVQRLADHYGLRTARVASGGDERELICASEWMLLSRDEGSLGALPSSPMTEPRSQMSIPLWTDHHSSLFQIFMD